MVTRSFQLAKILGADGDIKAGALDSAAISSGVTEYANATVLPSIGNSFGDQALVTSNNRLYIWNGSGWYNIALVNQNPSFTTSPAASYEFDGDSPRNDITITVAASDPESLGVSFSFETGGQLDSMATVTQDSSVFTLSPKGNDSLTAGVTLTGSLTIKASDGVNIVPAVSSFTLSFITFIEHSSHTQFLLKASGTGDNNNFDDKSTSNHSISASGTVTQGTFSPFRHGGYSMSFDGTGDYLQIADNADFDLAGEFAYEFWLYRTGSTSGTYQAILGSNGSGSNGLTFYITQSTGALGVFQSSFIVSGSAGDISDFKWHHVLLMRDSSNLLQLFIDGNRVSSSTNNTAFTDNSSGSGTRIGYDISANGYFKGFLTDIRLVKGSTGEYSSGTSITVPTKRLTAITNTKLLIGGNSFRDASTSNHTLTRNGDTFMAAFAPYDHRKYDGATHHYSALFDGNSDYLTYPNSTDFQLGTGDFTVEAWLYPNSIPGGGVNYDMTVFGHFGSPTMFFYISNNNLTPTLWNGSNGYGSSIDLQLKAWNHVAWVRESSTLKIYVNGVEGLSQASYTTNFNSATAPLTGKSNANSTRYFNGYIADLRVVKGTAVYTSAFTPPTAPLTAVTNTKLLMSMSDAKVIDASQNHNLVLQGSTAKASSAQQHFSENTIALDANSDYIELDEPAIPTTSEEDYTVDLWFYSADTGRKDFINQYLVSQNGRMALYSESAKIKFFQQGFNSTAAITGPTSWTANTWHHVALVNSGEWRQFYLDGNHEGGAYTAGSDMMVQNTKIGALNLNGTLQGFINGYMHDVRITKGLARFPYIAKPVTLTQTNSGMEKPDGTFPTATASNTLLLTCHTGTAGSSTITDGSSNSTSITANGNAVVSDFGPASGMKSVYFDGTGDYLSLTTASALGTGSWTIEYWVYHSSIASNGIHINFDGDSDYAPAFYFINTFDGFKVYHTGTMSNHSYSSGHVNALDSARIVANKWYHVAYSHDDSTGKLAVFVNGSFVAEASYSGNISSTSVRIGGSTLYNHMLNGYISNLRIVKGQALYAKNFTPLTTALLG